MADKTWSSPFFGRWKIRNKKKTGERERERKERKTEKPRYVKVSSSNVELRRIGDDGEFSGAKSMGWV